MVHSADREQETRLQFLEEAKESLNAIEDLVLDLSQGVPEPLKLDEALRSAHSIKGGAGMMGFMSLSGVAHQVEDVFKLIKIRRPVLSPEGVSLLLSSVDCLRQIISINQRGAEVNEAWLSRTAAPILGQLKDQLGELEPGEEEQLLTQDSGQDIVSVLFESEVEGCLNRLERVLNESGQPCLDTELVLLSQELGGLGEMLQLPAFTQLCRAIEGAAGTHPQQLEAIARTALDEWRRCQALVLVGQQERIPSTFSWTSASDAVTDTVVEQPVPEAEILGEAADELLEPVADLEQEGAELSLLFGDLDLSHLDRLDSVELDPSEDLVYEELDLSQLSTWQTETETVAEDPVEVAPAPRNPMTAPLAPGLMQPPTQLEMEEKEELAETSSIRVPLRRLEQLNDLCGELTIGCNGLDLRLSRLRTLMATLVHRVQNLEQSNVQLRNAYDRVATQALGNFGITGLELEGLRPEGFDILELDRYNELHPIWQEVMETIVWLQEVSGDMDLLLRDAERTAFEFNRTSKQMQISVTQSRMRPINDLVSRFPRAIRDMAVQFGKPTDLTIRGGSTLVDRTVLDQLNDPLTHLIRNAFDHGIEDPETRRQGGKPERGTIEIRAGYRGNQTVISISDDGNGIDFERVRSKAQRIGIDPRLLDRATERELVELIFEPGFSTAEAVTTLSGRGVGMDVVKTNLEKIGGAIQVDTVKGEGTTFTLSVPFTLSVMRVLLVESFNMLLAFPADTIEQMVLSQPDQFISTSNREAFNWEGYIVPKVKLEEWLEFRCPTRPIELDDAAMMSAPAVLVLAQGNDLICAEISRCWGEREVAIRGVEGPFPLPAGFSGTTILGDGQVVPIVNVPDLFEWAMEGRETAEAFKLLSSIGSSSGDLPMTTDRRTVLIVDDSINVRRFLALAVEKEGYRAEQAKDGQDALDKLGAGLEVDAIICDIEMPRLDGFGFLAQFQQLQQASQIPVVMLTSRTGDKHRKLALALGAADYFTKPCREKVLVDRVSELIATQGAVKG